MPNVAELSSLIDYDRLAPSTEFPDMPSNLFWSSSSNVKYTHIASDVSFYSGFTGGYAKTDNDHDVRCVRSGP